jgi:hypothetical protein
MNRPLARWSAALVCLAAQFAAAQSTPPTPATPPASTPSGQPTQAAPPAKPQYPSGGPAGNGTSKSITNEKLRSCMAEQRTNDPARTEADIRKYCESQLGLLPGT